MSRSAANLAATRAAQSAKAEAGAREYAFMTLVAGLDHYAAAKAIGRAAETAWRYKRQLRANMALLVDELAVYYGPESALEVARRFTAAPPAEGEPGGEQDDELLLTTERSA